MLSWILLIIVLLAFIVLGTWAFGSLFGRGELLPPLEKSRDVIAANAQAVREGRIDDVALEVVPRGYRQDQVDALIAQLARQATAKPELSPETSTEESALTSDNEISRPNREQKGVK